MGEITPFRPSARRGFLLLLVLVASIAYAAVQRQWSELLLFSYIAALPLAVAFMLREGQIYREEAKTSFEMAVVIAKLVTPVPVVAILFTPLGAMFYGIAAAFTDVFIWVALQLSGSGRSAALGVGVTALLGAVFFAFRLKFRFLYGMTEAVAGLAVAGHRVGFATPSEPGENAALVLAVLTAGVYLVVRGLDNAHQAWTSKTDLALNWVLSRKRQE